LKTRPFVASSAVALALAFGAEPALADNHPLPLDVVLAGDAKVPDAPDEYLSSEVDGFKVVYHPATRERVRALLPELDGIRAELVRELGVEVLAEVEIRVAALPLELERLAPPRENGAWTAGGAAFADKHLIVVAAHAGTADELEPAVRHLLAHVAFEEAANGATVPLWFQEGFAVHFAGDDRATRAETLELATLKGEPPTLPRLEHVKLDARGAAYAADFVRFASRERTSLPGVVSGLRSGLPFDRALETAFGADTSSIDGAWRDDMARRYAFLPTIVLGAFLFALVFVVGLVRRSRRAVEAPSRAIKKRRSRAGVSPTEGRIAIIHRADADATPIAEAAAVFPESHGKPLEVPKIEHDGRWHTLH